MTFEFREDMHDMPELVGFLGRSIFVFIASILCSSNIWMPWNYVVPSRGHAFMTYSVSTSDI